MEFRGRYKISPFILAIVFITFFHNVLSRHRIRHHKDRFKRQQGEHLYLPGSYVTEGGEGEDAGPWGDWTTPSPCSRTCGGGVSSQQRTCQDGYDCRGPTKRHFSCNTQDCPDNSDYRAQQCSEFNNIPFEGIYYEWIPYTKAPNPCELNCMPRGDKFYYNHGRAVIDGTRCNDEKNDVCVNGTCQPVGCDMMLGSNIVEDECRVCGGDGSSCNTFESEVPMKDMQAGYNDILLIPAGATNIRIEEIEPSNNYLAVRNTSGHYYLNGYYRIDFPRTMEFSGSKFKYERYPQEFTAPDIISALGPTDEPLFIVLLYQDSDVPVSYKYSLPKDIQLPSTETYAWTFDEFTECSASCGGGYQFRNVTCAERKSLIPADRALCDSSNEPETQTRCNTIPCPAQWIALPWKECSKPCGDEGGVQRRDVTCQRIGGDGVPTEAKEQECESEGGLKPDEERKCNVGKVCSKWHVGPWKPCDHLCGDGKQTRKVRCYIEKDHKIVTLEDSECEAIEPKPDTEKKCNIRPCEGVDWITSEWSGCERICGLKSETRKVHCATASGKIYPDDLCEPEQMPESVRECESTNTTCEYLWYASQWSECSVQCGPGVQTRTLFCGVVTEEGVKKVEDDKCDPSKHHETLRNCTGEKEECDGEWFSGPWGKCSKSCGGGERTKKVVCIKDLEVVDPSACGSDKIVFSQEDCNAQPCSEDTIMPTDVTQSVDESEPETDKESTKEEATTAVSELTKESESTASKDTDWTKESKITEVFEITTTQPKDTEKPEEEEDDDAEYEIVFASNCDDGEWVDSLKRMIEIKQKDEPIDTTPTQLEGLTTETTFSMDDMMLSDGTTVIEGESTFDFTADTGSGDDEVTSSSDKTASTISDIISTDEGSGTEPTIVSDTASTDETSLSSDTTPESSSESLGSSSSDLTTESSSLVNTDNTEPSSTVDSTTSSDASTDSSVSTTLNADTSETTVSSGSSESSSLSSSSSTDTSDSTTESVTTETSISTDSDATTESTSFSSSSSTYVTETTENTESTITETTDVSSTIDTSSTIIETSSISTDISSISSEITTDLTDTTGSDSTTETSLSTDISISTEVSGSTTELSSSISTDKSDSSSDSTTEFTTSSTEGTYSSTIFTQSTDSSGSTTEFTGSSETTTEIGSSTESTTEFTAITESTTEFTGSTESTETSSSTSEFGGSTTEFTGTTSSEESTTEFTLSTISGETTETDIFSSTTASGDTEETTIDLYGTTHVREIFSQRRLRMCKRRKIMTCKKTKWGCCWDNINAAKGPFDKGCPTPKTCKEAKYGCCPDGVSAALGPKGAGCPASQCTETLFGCCWDNKTTSEGNDGEGCPPKCLNTKWGCCDDNSTEAQGPNHKGCPEEVIETTTQLEEGTTELVTEVTTEEVTGTTNCTESTYRCCPDGKTPAEGPGFQGCGLPCSDSLNGCCGDGVTPAHGPSGEGCCLKSQFGCCPDNIVPARGLNGEGCDCQYSPYGCCPDNKTSAQGYNNEGCNCKFSEFGCCPDLATPAKGLDFEGCLCHTFQFGCCPDGVTTAKGPHQQGCGCRNMEFGCCSDQETPAKGSDMLGCGCETTEYGCCLDGTSEAKGEDFEGCEEIPTNKQAGCTVPKENGSCNNYTVKWFFDMAYGGCSRFWYGGCGGNENRYKSKEECDQICVQPQGKERCNLPKIPGPCEGYYPQWYYDAQLKQCAQFIYGGCLGNNNRFETREECQGLCESRSSLDACEQKVEQGPCRGSYLRYYFDKESGQCTEFQYGGCKGNQNNFLTKEACLQKCTSPGEKKEYCTLPKEKGNCTDILPNWYYDSAKRRCSPFYYSGCHGNQNNFEAKGTCEEDCPTEIAKDTCQLAAEVGECANYVDRWYYDTREKSCRQFYYGGCGGNGNNFETQQRCQQRCEQNEREVAPEPEPTEPAQVEPFTTDMCFLESETGPCRASFEKYFYDRTDGVCKKFTYGGCQGNRNNFDTIELCLQYCGAAQDLCTLPPVVGPCNGEYLQYYYDAPSDSCLPFNFGGCGGNYNRFQDKLSCEQRCKESPSQTIATQAPPVPSEIAMCYQPSDQGNCTERYVAFYYDQNARACAPFTYTGCGGNDNRFNSEEQCERQCGNFRGQDVCNMERDPGPCRGYFVKYYYDKAVARCEQFAYGGCQGNGNRFSSNEECEHICLTHDETKPNVSSTAACLLPVDQGSCEGGYHKRWYFDDRRGECIAFIYSGCGGNFNNFKTFQSCLNYCKELLPGTEPPVPAPVTDIAPHPCQEVFDECASLRCPYGVEPFVDENECNRCKCRDPCSQVECPEDEQCAIDINRNRTNQADADFVAICRKRIKPGTCPNLEQSDDNCERECLSDADCALDLKCCSTGCGSACVDPAVPAELVTQRPEPVFTEGPIEAVYQPPKVDPLSYEPQITALYGDQAVLNCAVTGNPNPKIRWRKGSLEIDGTQERYRIKLDQSLQIITLHKTDSGIYLCTADNGLGEPITNEITLNVVDSSPRPATVLDPQTSGLPAPTLVTLNAPAAVDCFALGNPLPAVTWWKDDSLIPFRNAEFEMRPDYSLLIHSVKLHNLGVYTCQAYNGVGKAASWSVAVRAMGPYRFTNRIEEKLYGPFIIDPTAPDTTTSIITTTTTARPSPVRLPPRRPTPQPYIPITDKYTEPPNEIWPEPPAATASIIVVPVRANITSSDQRYPVGSDIEIPCAIQGFPSPQVKWYKDGVELQNNDRIHISDSHKLTISEATKGDSGDYQCEATNAFSRASSTLSISIEGMYIHPSCTDNRFFANCALIVRAKICSHKYYARFCCRSCTEAGLLPVDGSHLRTLDRQNELDSNLA